MQRLRRRIWIGLRLQFRRIIYGNHSPRSIATGASIGVFIAFLPLYGFQMFLGAAVATIAKVNRPAAILPAWISNPLTIPPLLWISYKTGWFVMHFNFARNPEAIKQLKFLGDVASQFDWSAFSASFASILDAFINLGSSILIPTLLGCFVLSCVFAAITYPLTYHLIIRYRAMRRNRVLKRLSAAGYITKSEPAESTPDE